MRLSQQESRSLQGREDVNEPDEKGERWMSAFGRISQKRIDYGIFSDWMEMIAIVELDDKTHDPEKDAVRDSYTKSAGIKTLRFESQEKPTVATLRKRISECAKTKH